MARGLTRQSQLTAGPWLPLANPRKHRSRRRAAGAPTPHPPPAPRIVPRRGCAARAASRDTPTLTICCAHVADAELLREASLAVAAVMWSTEATRQRCAYRHHSSSFPASTIAHPRPLLTTLSSPSAHPAHTPARMPCEIIVLTFCARRLCHRPWQDQIYRHGASGAAVARLVLHGALLWRLSADLLPAGHCIAPEAESTGAACSVTAEVMASRCGIELYPP